MEESTSERFIRIAKKGFDINRHVFGLYDNFPIHERDEYGRTLLFYFIRYIGILNNILPSEKLSSAVQFLTHAEMSIFICDNDGKTVFFELREAISEPNIYESEGTFRLFTLLVDYLICLDIDGKTLLKRDNNNISVLDIFKCAQTTFYQFLNPFYPQLVGSYDAHTKERNYMKMDILCRYVIEKISQHINKRCTFFDMMFANINMYLK